MLPRRKHDFKADFGRRMGGGMSGGTWWLDFGEGGGDSGVKGSGTWRRGVWPWGSW